MRTIELEMSSADSAERLAHLVWREGRIDIVFIAEELRPALARWIAGGVREWVEAPGGQRAARITPATDPMFLRRLATDLRRQFNFSVDLDARDELSARVVTTSQRASTSPINLAPDSQSGLVTARRVVAKASVSTYEWRP